MFKSDKKVHGLGAACTIACSDYSPGILDVSLTNRNDWILRHISAKQNKEMYVQCFI